MPAYLRYGLAWSDTRGADIIPQDYGECSVRSGLVRDVLYHGIEYLSFYNPYTSMRPHFTPPVSRPCHFLSSPEGFGVGKSALACLGRKYK